MNLRRFFGTVVLLPVLLSFLVGCQPSDKPAKETQLTQNTQQVSEAPQTTQTSPSPPPPDIPEYLLSQGLRLMGAPFTEEIVYEVKGLDPTKPLRGSRRTTEVKIEKDGVRFVQTWTGDLESLGYAEYLSNKEGVSSIKVLNQPVEPPALTLPPSLSEGKQWEARYSLANMPNFGKTTVWQKFKVLKREKITVPIGTLDTWLVEMQSTFTGENLRASVTGKTWLAEGIGEVKSEFTRQLTTMGKTETATVSMVAIEKKPLSEVGKK